MKRVLICGFTENYGGMESYIMGIYRNIDRTKLQFDFVNVFDIDIAYQDEILALGGCIHYVVRKKQDVKKHYESIKRLFDETKYVAVYYQCNRKLLSLDIFKYAKKAGVPARIIHSHNSTQNKTGIVDLLRQKLVENYMDRYVNSFMACSKEAGEWMFSGRDFKIINNSVNTEFFQFNKQIREEFRLNYQIGEQIIIGTVGRLEDQKNPLYIVEIVKELYKQNKNIMFWHVGEGTLKGDVERKIQEYGLGDIYYFFDRTTQVYKIMNAMDVFILPSKHEGFPIVLVEAQATGLPCIVADNITTACNLTDDVEFLSIEIEPCRWATKILEAVNEQRHDRTDIINKKGYDINSVANQMQEYFCNIK